MTDTIAKNTTEQAATKINAFYEALSNRLEASLVAHIKGFITWAQEEHSMNELFAIQVMEQFNAEGFIDHAQDVVSHGISGGFNGFIYYEETIAFYESNKELIIEQTKRDRNRFDSSISLVDFIASFSCMKDNDISVDMIGEFLYSNKTINDYDRGISEYEDEKTGDYTQFVNGMAWAAAEVVCRAYSDYVEQNGAYE